jgi:hypothetical protein
MSRPAWEGWGVRRRNENKNITKKPPKVLVFFKISRSFLALFVFIYFLEFLFKFSVNSEIILTLFFEKGKWKLLITF